MSTPETEARRKIKELSDWFEGRELPKGSFKLNRFTTVTNCHNYVATLRSRLSNPNVYSKEVQASYQHLKDLKEFFENERQNKP